MRIPFFTRATRPTPPVRKGSVRRRKALLEMEALEDRCVPAVINVNSLADVLNPGPGVVTLRSAIQQANATPGGNTINLTLPGTYKITLPGTVGETDNAAGEFSILPTGGNLTIQNTSGGAVTIDGNHLARVFDINPNFDPANPTAKFTVTMQGFTIQNGVALDPNNPDGPNASGGGIRDVGNASLTLNNVVVTNNSATADGGGIVFENLQSVPWTLTTNNTVISNNHAGDAGGGIDTDGSGKVFLNAGTVLTGNTCVNQGAGIWLDAILVGNEFQTANLTVTDAVISGNTAETGLGGGLGNAGNGTVTITNSTVENNFSGATGGGFGDENSMGTLVIQNSLFLDNSAVGDGGGVAAGSPAMVGGPSTTITLSEFKGNASGANGGAVFANGVTLTVLDSTFAGNTAQGNGGGFEIETTGTGAAASFITSSTIYGNSALNANPGDIGGGIDVGNAGLFTGTLTLLNDTVNANFAFSGGGVAFANGGTVNVQNTIIAGNHVTNDGPDYVTVNGQHFTSLGGNLIGVNNGDGAFAQMTDQNGTPATPLDPLLAPLGNYGGPTVGVAGPTAVLQSLVLETEALLPGSPALGKGVANGAPTMDGRGFQRAGGVIDVGAFQSTATANSTPNQRYVNALYQLLLHRAADPGSAGWVSLLNQGFSPAAIVLGIESSDEYRFDEVQSFYQRFLHRDGDMGGLQAFVGLLRQGFTAEQVESIFLSSPEYLQLHGGTQAGFLQGLYQDVLGRQPDAGGLSYFNGLLNAGITRGQVAAAILSSPEAFIDLVASDYQAFLGRAADSAGSAGFVLALQSGATDPQVLAAILGSAEAFTRLT